MGQSIDEEVAKGTIRHIEPFDLLLSVISLNAFVFLAHPIVDMITNGDEKVCEDFLEHRKKENIELIISRLRK